MPVLRTVEALVPRREVRFDRVRQAVEARVGRQFRHLRVEVVDGLGVVLHGEAASYHAKQLAQHVVGLVTGAAVLANRIEVRPTPELGVDPRRPIRTISGSR